MSDVRCKISLILLLLFVMMTTAAEDGIRRGCRRGVQLIATRSHRSLPTPFRVGGDFYHGDRRQLVVLAAFRDQAFEGDETTALSKWDKIFNADHYQEESFVGSVHDYFYAQSYGKLNLMFDLIHVNLPDNLSKYHSTPGEDGDDENSQYMVDDIVDTLQTLDIDWSLYDWNGDGYVNQLLIIYAGRGMNNGGGSNTIWPHQWWLSRHVDQTTGDRYRSYRTVNTADKTFIIDCYCCAQEVVNQLSTKSSFGTICHEYTHCFGFPDLYGTTKTPHAWDLMDDGNYNGIGFCPPNYSAHERYLMGWLTPKELTEATTIADMPALCDEPQAYLIRNDGYENEFYMVENRQQKEWDAHIPGSGIVVFHIDYDEAIWCGYSSEPVNSNNLLRYHIIPANNEVLYFYSNGWAYPYEGNNSLTNTSAPEDIINHVNTDGTYHMNKPLTNMQVTDGLASFDFMEKPSAIQTIKSVSIAENRWYDLQGRQLSDRPQRKGLYILDSRKMVVK